MENKWHKHLSQTKYINTSAKIKDMKTKQNYHDSTITQ